MAEASAGKDSVTGHWELAGLVLDRPFPTFPHGFPGDLIAEYERRIGRSTIGNTAASGTVIIEQLGPEHLRTGAPIVYTSADSVFQVAAHEEVIPVAAFVRTANRHDFAMVPTGPTLLDRLVAGGRRVHAIGKIADLFAGRGVTSSVHTSSDDEGMDAVIAAVGDVPGGLVFANLVDFDTQYGHRNDVEGYARNLERFDGRLAELLPRLRPDDLLVVTADHGNDPSTPSMDHSREHVPVLVSGAGVRPGTNLGTRPTFADLGQSLAEFFDVPALPHGTSFLKELR
jgi:phosphopentomutase